MDYTNNNLDSRVSRKTNQEDIDSGRSRTRPAQLLYALDALRKEAKENGWTPDLRQRYEIIKYKRQQRVQEMIEKGLITRSGESDTVRRSREGKEITKRIST
tara:strand:- start:1047 stop:1352 length:306 start_codon:yes stop_codon:yes gene_type:complete